MLLAILYLRRVLSSSYLCAAFASELVRSPVVFLPSSQFLLEDSLHPVCLSLLLLTAVFLSSGVLSVPFLLAFYSLFLANFSLSQS